MAVFYGKRLCYWHLLRLIAPTERAVGLRFSIRGEFRMEPSSGDGLNRNLHAPHDLCAFVVFLPAASVAVKLSNDVSISVSRSRISPD
jgi:hypothetical protein